MVEISVMESSVRTRSDTTPVNSDPVPTQYISPHPRSHSVSIPVVPHLRLCFFHRDSDPIPYVFLHSRRPSYYVFILLHSGLLPPTDSSDLLRTPFRLGTSYVSLVT